MFGNNLSKVEKAIQKNNPSALVELAEGKDAEQKIAAILGLGKLGGENAINYLVTKLNDADPKIRIAVAQALGAIADPHTKAHVSAQRNRETDSQVREALSKAMAGIGGY
jgi:HEAT repeat protein